MARVAVFSGHARTAGSPRVLDCGSVGISGDLQEERRRIMLGQDVGDRMQVTDTAFRAQRRIDPLAGEIVVDVGDEGLLRVGETEQPAAFDETLLALAVDKEAVEADAMEARRQHVAEEATDEFLGR